MKKVLYGLAAICLLTGLTFLFSCPPKSAQVKPIKLLTPEDGAINVALTTEMTWELTIDPKSNFYEYDVFLGPNDPPSNMVGTHLSLPSFYPTLSTGSSYFWKVVGVDYSSGNTIESHSWQFTTEE